MRVIVLEKRRYGLLDDEDTAEKVQKIKCLHQSTRR